MGILFGHPLLNKNLFRIALVFILVFMQAGCNAQHQENLSKGKRNKDYLLLGLIGFNYTNRYIDNYSINGAGGGYVRISSPDSGGSGETCCVRILKTHTEPFSVVVRWQVDGCKYVVRDPRTGATEEVKHFYYKEAEVTVENIARENASFIETHFYPDGSVKVLLTEAESDPRLILDEKRADKSSFPRCKNDEKPEQ